MDKKLNGFNNGRDTTDGVGGGESMFDDMMAQGSNIPNKVEYLQSHGWQSYKHHDNWVRKDLKDFEKDLCNFDLNSAYEEALREANELPNAIKVLQKHLSEDKSEGSYYYSWQANIAMAFKDEMARYMPLDVKGTEEVHQIANRAAKNFLDLLIKE